MLPKRHAKTSKIAHLSLALFLLSGTHSFADTSTSMASPVEGRLYLDLGLNLFQKKTGLLTLSLAPMFRTEQHFRQQGLVYLKTFAGLRWGLFSWLRFQLYYAYQDKLLNTHKQAHMLVADLILSWHIGPLRLLNRNGNEWHVTDQYDRYRNYMEVLSHTWWQWLNIWVAEEFRVDSDQARVNMNDLRTGLTLTLTPHLHIKLFYDLEAQHRSKTDWSFTHYFGTMILLRFHVKETPQNTKNNRFRHIH